MDKKRNGEEKSKKSGDICKISLTVEKLTPFRIWYKVEFFVPILNLADIFIKL